MSNVIKKRIYYAIDVELTSPINISSGDSELTDSDLIRNGNGEFFVPGTSIAGALFARLSDDDKKIAGYTTGEYGKMSSLFVSDLYFNSDCISSVRDGVKLTSEKKVDNKFDMQVLETGAKGTIYINYIIREMDDDKEALIKVLITDIEKGFVRFGSNKNRGYGKMHVLKIYRQVFDQSNIRSLLEFDNKNTENYTENYDYKSWADSVEGQSEDYVKISVPLKLTGGISIRKYSTRPNEADFEQITIHEKDKCGNCIPVVPGTSWNGAIRSAVFSVLKDLNDKEALSHVNQWFGYVDINNKKSGQSIVIFGESKIMDSVPLIMTRNKINRFDASTIDRALYTEKAFFGGHTSLEIMIKKDESRQYEELIGVLQIVISDIQKGYISFGGQTSVGRGIFEADTEKTIEYQNALSEKAYSEALYEFIMGGR